MPLIGPTEVTPHTTQTTSHEVCNWSQFRSEYIVFKIDNKYLKIRDHSEKIGEKSMSCALKIPVITLYEIRISEIRSEFVLKNQK